MELDSISGRIAQQLYPKADITVAGFETTDRRDFYDLAVGNVPFGQYQVRDKAYLHSAAYASQHGEMAQYNRSYSEAKIVQATERACCL
ncbi:MAG: hypothetical protein PUJ39_04820 [Eubacteriales bacterium]|nr:hypothetical protein [Eubacteriales bacterium]